MTVTPDPEWWEWLADTSADLLADRERGYPALVERGRMSRADADDGIRIMASIVADWRRITDLYAGRSAAPEDLTAAPHEKQAALKSAVDRLRATFDRLFAALPRVMPAAIGGTVAGYDRHGLTIEDLIVQANAGILATDALRPAANAYDRLRAAELMHWYSQREIRPMFWAELTEELRARKRARAAA